MHVPSDSVFDGEYRNNKANGWGIRRVQVKAGYQAGRYERYEGDYVDYKRSGVGKYVEGWQGCNVELTYDPTWHFQTISLTCHTAGGA